MRAWRVPLKEAARAAWLAYSRADIEDAKTDTQVALVGDWVAFRGTTNLADWRTNLRTKFVGLRDRTLVHGGFFDAWSGVRPRVLDYCADSSYLRICGHSLGGGIAQVAAVDAASLFGAVELVTFGAPRAVHQITPIPGNITHTRVVNNCDIVARVPSRASGYTHWGDCVYFDHNGERADLEGWALFLDRVAGRFDDFGTLGTAGVNDHGMPEYLRLAGTV